MNVILITHCGARRNVGNELANGGREACGEFA